MLRDGKVPTEPEDGDGRQSPSRFHLFLEVMALNKYPLGVVAPALLLGVIPDVTVALDVEQIQY
jgi:hypothetical protein